MNIVGKHQIRRAHHDRSRERDRRREFPSFAHLVRAVTGFDFSVAESVKSWAKPKYHRVWENTNGAIRFSGVPLRHVNDWAADRNNLKVSANLTSRSRMTLVYLDFDCHVTGDPADARALCGLVRANLPHGEVLVSDRGASAWVLVDLDGVRPKPAEYNALLDRVERYVRGVAAAHGLNLSGVEIKGRVPRWDRHGRVERCADVFKCPKAVLHIGQAVTYDALRSTDWTPPAAAPKAKARLRAGSRSLLTLSPEQAKGIDHVVNLVRAWFPDRPTRTANGRLITDERFAEVVLVMAHLRPNEDGSTPHRFAEAVWRGWHAEGLLRYGWVSEAWQTVRDYLSAGGYLHAEDEGRYVAPLRNAGGIIETRGRAARWCLADWVRAHVRATAAHGSVWDAPADDREPGWTGLATADGLSGSGSGTHTRGGELVHSRPPYPPGRRQKPWRVHQEWGVRPLSKIPAHDWERLLAVLAV